MIELKSPFNPEEVKALRAGDAVKITGVIYTGRDAAHKRLCELLAKNEKLPIDVNNMAIYYVGPTPAKPGRAIGSAGPTSSYRMDAYSEPILKENPNAFKISISISVGELNSLFPFRKK